MDPKGQRLYNSLHKSVVAIRVLRKTRSRALRVGAYEFGVVPRWSCVWWHPSWKGLGFHGYTIVTHYLLFVNGAGLGPCAARDPLPHACRSGQRPEAANFSEF